MVIIPIYQLILGQSFDILQYNSQISYRSYQFYSSDPLIATINNFGIITPIKTGYFFFTIANFQNETVFTSNSIQVIEHQITNQITNQNTNQNNNQINKKSNIYKVILKKK